MNDTWRLFIALRLPTQILDVLADLQTDLKKALPPQTLKWTKPESIHLTLKFLGDVPKDQIDNLPLALDELVLGQRAFKLGIEGLGCFPDTQHPRVLWVGIGGEAKMLKQLQKRVERSIAPLGYPAEKRAFTPHLTLARAHRRAYRDDLAEVGQYVQEADIGWLAEWQVKSVSLMRSQLNPHGAIYTQVSEARLTAAND